MHPTIDELLAFRDSEADPATASHVEGCPRCLKSLDEIRAVADGLRSLPELRPPTDRWPELRRSVAARRRRTLGARAVGAAASVALALTLGSAFLAHRASQDPAAELVPEPTPGEQIEAVTAELVATSRQLELILEQRTRRPRVVTARRAAAVALLEDRLAVVDAAIATTSRSTEPEPNAGLWLHRVQLLDALVTVTGPSPGSSDVQHAVLGY